LKLESQDIKNQKIQELKNIFPEIFKDGQINYDTLKEILDDEIDEVQSEHYSFSWAGKKECYKTIKEKSNSTLKVDSDTTIPDGENVFIEGDNLEVLKLLQTSYHKKVKMIYIDPPYNKDKDFVYSDTWGDSITNYLIQTDQLRDEGYTTSKTNSTGRRHTNWLNMIYPRLWLSRNLLKDDGVIFVSIDDDEVHNLRKVMDEIYGEENFVGQFIWQKKKGGGNDSKFIANEHEYIIAYCKNSEIQNNWYEEYDNDYLKRYKEEDDNGKYFWDTLQRTGLQSPIIYDIEAPDGSIITGEWVVSKKRFDTDLENGKIRIKELKGGKWSVQFKQYMGEGKKPRSILNSKEVGLNSEAKNTIKELFQNDKLFSNPKPINLIKNFIKIVTNKNDIILDFFAGSGTTAHAVMELNQEDNGNRKYILVQLPESTDEKSEAYKNSYKKISDITKERIKRVIEKLDYKDGFKSYYLDISNFQVFKELKKRPNDTFEDIVKMLKMSVFNRNIFTQSAKELDIVYEVGLKNGFSLSAKNEEIDLGNYKAIKLYEEDRVFYFCFADKVEMDIQEFIPEGVKLICYDKAFDDSTKLNLRQNIDLETL
jgi:adenine-specific DNA-methyltransferase